MGSLDFFEKRSFRYVITMKKIWKWNDRFENYRFWKGWNKVMIFFKKKKRNDHFGIKNDRFGKKMIVLINRFGIKTTNKAYFNEQ